MGDREDDNIPVFKISTSKDANHVNNVTCSVWFQYIDITNIVLLYNGVSTCFGYLFLFYFQLLLCIVFVLYCI